MLCCLPSQLNYWIISKYGILSSSQTNSVSKTKCLVSEKLGVCDDDGLLNGYCTLSNFIPGDLATLTFKKPKQTTRKIP